MAATLCGNCGLLNRQRSRYVDHDKKTIYRCEFMDYNDIPFWIENMLSMDRWSPYNYVEESDGYNCQAWEPIENPD